MAGDTRRARQVMADDIAALADEFNFYANDSAHIGLGHLTTLRGKMVPVTKQLELGSRGGLKFLNSKGRYNYVKRPAKRQCLEEGYVPGGSNDVCKRVKVHEEDLPVGLRGKIPKYGRFYEDKQSGTTN